MLGSRVRTDIQWGNKPSTRSSAGRKQSMPSFKLNMLRRALLRTERESQNGDKRVMNLGDIRLPRVHLHLVEAEEGNKTGVDGMMPREYCQRLRTKWPDHSRPNLQTRDRRRYPRIPLPIPPCGSLQLDGNLPMPLTIRHLLSECPRNSESTSAEGRVQLLAVLIERQDLQERLIQVSLAPRTRLTISQTRHTAEEKG